MERQKQRKEIELLAPAGSRDAFYGAVHAGADAIYMGGEKFGARAYADNFSREELIACIRYGHIHGCRSYLTVNTLMKEQELAELVEELHPLYETGLDGVIVQDIGALQVIRRHFPSLMLHASTQMTVTGPEGAKLLKELGVSRVVPARELSLRELGHLKRESGLEVEAFVHGAMCYCYSGACLFSSLLGGRSGNRGRCAQPCRLPYDTDSPGASVHRKEYYPLSLKDLCTIEHLPELIEGGIDSLKIEGRMKKPEYAAGVTALYRKYIDRYLAHPEKPFHVEDADLEALSKLYIRSQRQDGYFFRQNGREMVTLESPSYSGSDETYLEQVRQRYIEQKKRLKVWMKAGFVCGQPARLQMGTGDCKTEVWGSAVEPAQSRPILEADIRKQLQKLGDTCFALESLEINTDEKGFYPLKEINVLRREAARQLEDQIIAGHGLIAGRGRVTGYDVAERRKAALDILPPDCQETSEISTENLESAGASAGIKADGTSPVRGLRVHISTKEQLLYLAGHLPATGEEPGRGQGDGRPIIDRLYVESCLLLNPRTNQQRRDLPASDQGKKGEKVRQAVETLQKAGIALWIALPYILRGKDRRIMENAMKLYRQGKIQGFLVRNLEEYGWLQQEAGASWRITPQADSTDLQGPPSQEQCLLRQEQYPPHQEQCPLHQEQCPLHQEQCPPYQEQCPLHQEQCPPYQEQCSLHQEQCPPYQEQCPPYQEQCSPHQEQCSPHQEQCPPYQEQCPLHQEQCPPYQEQCSPYQEQCPPYQEQCLSHQEQYPPRQEQCSPHQEQCLPYQGQCPPHQQPQLRIQLDHTVYVWNSRSAAFWRKKGCGLTCPLELNGREWGRLLGQIRYSAGQFGRTGDSVVPEKLVYGHIPMMVTANCIAKTAGKCLQGQDGRAEGALTDRYLKKFPVEICCDVCMNVIYNSVPLSLHKESVHNVYKRLSFTMESGREMWQIIKFFADKINTNASVPPYRNYTAGHEKKGVL